MTFIIDGKALAERIRQEVAEEVEARWSDDHRAPCLATVLVGDDPASAVYVASKRRAVRAAGMRDVHRLLPGNATQSQVAQVLDELARDCAVTGILLQLPLPGHLDTAALIDRIPARKDVDGLTTASAGLLARGVKGMRPCTPGGIMELLDEADIQIESAHAVVVGRSELVGKPMAQLLLQRHATVTIAHSRTKDLAAVTREADILVVAAGVPDLVGRQHVRVGAAVIDVGIHRSPAGLIGDVRAAEVDGIAGWRTPVPGGVGPMTIAMLLSNTLCAATWFDASS